MKSIVTYLAGFSLLTITTLSCSKDGQDEMRQQAQTPQIIKASVPTGEAYVFNMGMGTAASIQTQALHFQRSEIATATDGSAVYNYIPAKGYSGTDEVTLLQTTTSTTSQSSGCHRNNNGQYTTSTAFKTIVIKFDVGK